MPEQPLPTMATFLPMPGKVVPNVEAANPQQTGVVVYACSAQPNLS